MFENATRLKLRFETARGLLSVEDLWDLPLTTTRVNGVSLDDLAVSLNRQIKNEQEESFVVKATTKNEELHLRFDIVKHIIDVKLAENAAAAAAADRKAQKERILELIARKQDQQLEGKSLEELQQMVSSL